MDIEYISRASRALAAMTLVRQATANEIHVPSGAEYETWIDEHRTDYWTVAGWLTVVIMTCCILVGLELQWWKSGRVVETIDNGTQTLEEGRCSQSCTYEDHDHEARQGQALQKLLPILVKKHVFQSLS